MSELTDNKNLLENRLSQANTDAFILNEVYIDGKLKSAELVDEKDKSYGIFMHSLILSNSIEFVQDESNQFDVDGDEYEKAIYYYTSSKGFNKNLMENIAPKVSVLSSDHQDKLKASAHLINGKFRVVSKGAPEVLIKRCTYLLCESKIIKLSRKVFAEVNEILKIMISRSLNVYAIAIKDTSKFPDSLSLDSNAIDMTLVALVGIGNA